MYNVDGTVSYSSAYRYVKKEDSGASHRWYAYSYLGCACLNLAMVVASIYLLDAFISGEFADLGWRYIDPGNDRNQNQLLQDIFPKMTICQVGIICSFKLIKYKVRHFY